MAKILAIDDKEDNLVTLSALLKSFVPHCTVITACSGLEGIEKTKVELPDTILLDINMPGMDGYEVCRKLKSDEKTKHVPVIMITATRTDPKSRVKGLDIGADAFLSKPIDETELTAQVNVMLRIKKTEDLLRKERDLLEETVQERTRSLMESEERFREMFEQSPFGIALIGSLTGHIYEVNRKFAEIAGRTIEAMADIDRMSITHPDDLQEDLDNMAALNAGDISGFNMDKRYIRPDGSHVWINMTVAPVTVEDKAHPRHLCMIEDITERRRTQEERDRLETQLQQALKMEAIGTLSGGIAHDFNNILGVIMGCTELSLLETPEETPIREYLSEVLTASNRAKDLVKQILTFSRQSKQEESPLAIGIIIEEALKMLRSSLPSTIEIKQNIQRDSGLAMADPTQIHQIIMNLATNAAHAMRGKGGVLNVSVADVTIDDETAGQHQDLEPGPHIKLTVSDTGHGMAPDIVERIFEPYYTTKDVGEGTGLGLSVIHGIIQGHKGAICVDSEPGKGTTFEVFFPKIEFAEKQSEISETVRLATGTGRILFVDDEPSMAKIYQTMLQRLGYEASVRTSSVEALNAFKAEPDKYDLIITDQTMPHLTGEMLAREMMTIRPGIPVILCSGYSDSISEDKARAMGIRAFVMKPISMVEIANTIRDVLHPELPERR